MFLTRLAARIKGCCLGEREREQKRVLLEKQRESVFVNPCVFSLLPRLAAPIKGCCVCVYGCVFVCVCLCVSECVKWCQVLFATRIAVLIKGSCLKGTNTWGDV